jgi:hypothetical protein
MTKRRPPSSLGRLKTSGRTASALSLLWGMVIPFTAQSILFLFPLKGQGGLIAQSLRKPVQV